MTMPFTMMFNVLPGHLSSTPTALLSAMLLSLAPQPVARLFFIKNKIYKIRRTKTYKQAADSRNCNRIINVTTYCV